MCRAAIFATAASMPSGPHAYSITRRAGVRAASRRSSGATTRPRSPALPSSVVSTSVDAERRGKNRDRTAPRPAARRRTASWRTPRARQRCRRASRTAPARRRRRPSTLRRAARRARTGGRAGRGRRRAGPAARRRASAVDGPMRLFRIEMPDGCAGRIAQQLEDRKRPPEQRVVAAPMPSPSRTVRARRPRRWPARRARARCNRPTAAVRDHVGGDVGRHRGSILGRRTSVRYLRMLSNSLAAALLASTYVLDRVPAAESLASACARAARADRGTRRVALRAASHRVLLRAAGRAGSCSRARPFSPAWLSVRVLLWLCAVAALGGAAADVARTFRRSRSCSINRRHSRLRAAR